MPTSADLIKSAAIKLGAIATGEALTADEADDSLKVLNSMLDYWAIDKTMVYQIVQNSYTWPAATSSRTIGATGNFVATRPVKIEEGTYFLKDNISYPVAIVKDRISFDYVSSKTSQATYPEIIYYEPAFPNATLHVYPVPSASITLNLNSWQTLQSFAALTTELSLPPGYQWCIEHNLSVALEAVFTVPVPANVAAEAARSKAMIKRVNHIPLISRGDLSGLYGTASIGSSNSRSNILSG